MIQDLIGIACLRLGLDALHDQAQRQGDAVGTTLYAVALADTAGNRHATAERLTVLRIQDAVRKTWRGLELSLDDHRVSDVLSMATGDPSRRFRIESLGVPWMVRNGGAADQRTKATKALDLLGADADPLVAAAASARANRSWNDDEALAALLGDQG